MTHGYFFPFAFEFASLSPQILYNDWSSWNAYYFDLWPFCGANRVPDIIIPCSLIIFPAARQAARQPKPLFAASCWQVSAFPDYYSVILWLLITRPTSSCVLQLKSDGPQVEQGYSVAAVCLSGTEQHGEQMICRTVHNNSLYSTGSIAGVQSINWQADSWFRSDFQPIFNSIKCVF